MNYREFTQIKVELKNGDGLSYNDFKRNLRPNYNQVWREIAFGYLAWFLTMLLTAFVILKTEVPDSIIVVVGAISLGYWFHYIQTFYHAASHYNLHPSREWNDKLANLLINIWIGSDIKKYRKVHFQHHTHLGTTADPERSYFNSLNLKFIFEMICGVHALKTFFVHSLSAKRFDAKKDGKKKKKIIDFFLLRGIFLHIVVLFLCFKTGGIPLVLTWLIGIGVFGFFFGALRQLLEHRSVFALDGIDYSQTDHGEENRMFGEGLIASTLGAAGFNRHLLHHWEPQISYTNLKELEEFLCETHLKSFIDSKRTTYFNTLGRLFRWKTKKIHA